MTTMCRSSRHDAVTLRRALGRLEDEAARSGWAWDAVRSRRADALLVLIEAGRA